MDPGARLSLLTGAVTALAVLAAALFLPVASPVLALGAGLAAGALYVRRTRRPHTGRAGQGGLIAAPPIVAAQAVGSTLQLTLLGGGLEMGARLSVLAGGRGQVAMPPAMIAAVVLLLCLLDLALVLASAELTARRALSSDRNPRHRGAD